MGQSDRANLPISPCTRWALSIVPASAPTRGRLDNRGRALVSRLIGLALPYAPQDPALQIECLQIPDVLCISPTKHGDERGFFSEVYRHDALAGYGVDLPFVQDNHVLSAARGVLRGLHFQLAPSAQGKLIRCTKGAILDVAVDIRRGSPTFGRHVAVELSADNWRQVWVPPGFAHGYVTLEPDCEVIYKVTSYYDPASERGLAWDDPALGIDWRVPVDQLTISPKDRVNPILADLDAAFGYADEINAD